ncbi:hypothetical protein CASFOL_033832 [Castilleja foliolosa]|uniref:DC1 domain-containing protein n=1 Tax=Castilleja foliolosa TaxID=1961234 RepID=A0ABD3BZR5_9LAMI
MSIMIMKASRDDEIKQVVEKQKQQFNHFSHRHPLSLELSHTNAACSGCEHEISGSAYVCTKPECGFLLHDLCFDLPRRILHGSHPSHPLFLLHSPPYTDNKESTCNACSDLVHAFTYHCETCRFDLHVECASLPEFEIRRDHMHPLLLLWDAPDTADDSTSVCYVCNDDMEKGYWRYSCLACNCGVHLECITANP